MASTLAQRMRLRSSTMGAASPTIQAAHAAIYAAFGFNSFTRAQAARAIQAAAGCTYSVALSRYRRIWLRYGMQPAPYASF